MTAAEPCDWVCLQETVDQRRIQREISILRRLTHGSIIQLLEIVETEHFIFLVSFLALHVLLFLPSPPPLTVWGVQPVLTHQTSWLGSTSVVACELSLALQSTVSPAACVLHCLHINTVCFIPCATSWSPHTPSSS